MAMTNGRGQKVNMIN
jgi:hypothetical protein